VEKKISLSFGIVVIAFLLIFYILIKGYNTARLNDYKAFRMTITRIVNERNANDRMLYTQLTTEQKANDELQALLSQTKNDLDALTKKLGQPTPAAAPVAAPSAAPAAVPAAATK